MKLTLRPYQDAGIVLAQEALAIAQAICGVAPTGAGKTVWVAKIIEIFVLAGMRVLFLAHRKELIDQTSAMLDYIGIPHGVLQGNHHRRRPGEPVQVASIQTLSALRLCESCKNKEELRETCNVCDGRGKLRSRKLPEAHLVVVDETHRVLGDSYSNLLANYPNAKILGITATPWRLDGRGLSKMFNKLIVFAEASDLVRDGWLVPARVFGPKQLIDLSAVSTSRGDYQSEELSIVMRQTGLIGNIVAHWHRHAEGLRTVAFASSVAHSQDIVRRFCEDGVAAEHLDGTTPKGQREAILARLAKGTTRVVSNVDVLCEGWDLPSLGCVALARPTLSLTRFLQQTGRSRRPCCNPPGPCRCGTNKLNAIILDHANCTRHHGLPDDPRQWSLDDRPGRRKAPPVELTLCEKCGAYFRGEECKECNPEQMLLLPRVPDETDDDLVEYTAGALARRAEQQTQAPARSSRRREGGVWCSRCHKTWVPVRSGAAGVKVTCSACIRETERAR